MNHKLSSADLSPRNPKVHRQAGIPSVSRSRTFTTGGIQETSEGRLDPVGAGTGRAGPFSTLKKTAQHVLSKAPEISPSFSPLRPRFASMPARHQSHRASTPLLADCSYGSTSKNTTGRDNSGKKLARTLDCTPKRATKTIATAATNHASVSVTPTVTFKGHTTSSTLPASARKPDPRLILSSLRSVLGTEHDIDNYLDAHDLLAMHQLDQVDFEDRARMRENWDQHVRLSNAGQKPVLTVLGEPIRKASIYSTTSMVLGGREHDLPIIVVNTVEELYRTGIYQENLFRTLPNRARLLELIEIYDSQEHPSRCASRQPQATDMNISGFGANVPLHLESTADVCALLTTYLTSLTEPVLPPMFFHPVWDLCGLSRDDTWPTRLGDSFGPRLSHIPMARTYTSAVESNHILVAQLLLHLLPSPNFSLLVYLLAFFSQVALVHQENGVNVADLSKMFGRRLFGGEIIQKSAYKDSDDETITQVMDGETMMSWFLCRWAPLSDGLFEVIQDVKMGLLHRPLARRDSFGKDVLASWPLGIEDSRTSPDLPSSEINLCSNDLTRTEDLPSWSDIHLEDAPIFSRLKKSETYLQSPPLSERNMDKDYTILTSPTFYDPLDDMEDITGIRVRPSNVSGSSTVALDERLLDATFPTLLNQTLPAIPIISDDTTSKSFTHCGTQTASLNPVELVDALQYASYLESQLEERTLTLKNTLAELTQSKIDASKLRQQVHKLEAALEAHPVQKNLSDLH